MVIERNISLLTELAIFTCPHVYKHLAPNGAKPVKLYAINGDNPCSCQEAQVKQLRLFSF